MSYILNIDTAVVTASVCLSKDGNPLLEMVNLTMKDHASWIQPAIQQLIRDHGILMSDLDAVAVSGGPGSYTGLRVGMATAKGLCYALEKPLLTVSTLRMMASASEKKSTLLCPMIDARRMEVFTAVYDNQLNEVVPPTNLILEPHTFQEILDQHQVFFFGNGSEKSGAIMQHPNAEFGTVTATARHMSKMSVQLFETGQFSDLAYAEPFYGKDFYLAASK